MPFSPASLIMILIAKESEEIKPLFKHSFQVGISPCLIFLMYFHVPQQLCTGGVTDGAPRANLTCWMRSVVELAWF